MDKLSSYRNVIKQVLAQHAEYTPSHGQIEAIPIFDERNDNYLLVDVGWDRTGRVHCVALHLRIKNGKVWEWQSVDRTGWDGRGRYRRIA